MYTIMVCVLMVMPSVVQAMSSDDAMQRVLEIAVKYEEYMTAAHINELEEVLPHVADINEANLALSFFSQQNAPLTCAADAGNITACRILIAHKADVNKADFKGTPLKHATNPNMIKFLREMGATR